MMNAIIGSFALGCLMQQHCGGLVMCQCKIEYLIRKGIMKKQNCCFDFKFVAYINDEDHHLKVCLWMPYTTLLKQVEDAL